MFQVASSAVTHLGHNGTDTLQVRFPSGDTYEYKGVSAMAFQKFVTAKSIGQHFQANIRGRYQERKLA